MALVLTLKQEPWCFPRPRNLRLHHLPLEIRLLIYSLVLLEPALWDRTHDLTCPLKPIKFDDPNSEVPPFVQQRTNHDRWSIEKTAPCSCGKRKGLGLLGVCRQIYNDAESLLWTRNTFCFMHGFEFTVAVGRDLSAKRREQLRSLSVIRPPSLHYEYLWGDKGERSTDVRKGFWEVVQQCKSLSKFEVAPTFVEHLGRTSSGGLDGLVRQLPNLASLDLTQFVNPRRSLPHLYFVPITHDTPNRVSHMKFSHKVFLSQRDNKVDPGELCGYVQGEFKRQVHLASRQQLLFPTSHLLRNHYVDDLPNDLHEYNNTRCLTLPSGERVPVTFYGLPAVCHRTGDDTSYRVLVNFYSEQKTKQTQAQHKAELQERLRKKELLEEENTQELEAQARLARDRRRRREAIDEVAEKAADKEKAKVQRAIKQREKNKVSQRKRTNRGS